MNNISCRSTTSTPTTSSGSSTRPSRSARSAARVIKKVPALRGRTVVNLFYENSTRTRISFELAAKRLSADVINFSTSGSSVSKGESLKDTALTLQAMGADAIVIRHSSSGAPLTLTRWVNGSVLNAGDGTHEHPTQALLDLYTMREPARAARGAPRRDRRRRPALAGRPVALVRAREDGRGDHARRAADADPADAPAWGVEVAHDIEAVLPKLDVCYLLRVQRERQRQQYFPSVREYSRLFGLTRARVGLLPEEALVMHPGPMNRGIEIDSDVADLPRAVIEEQVTNGIAIRMSLLYLLLGGAGLGEAGRRRRRDEGPMAERILFRGARVIDPAAGRDEVADVLVADGAIAPSAGRRERDRRRLRRPRARAGARRPPHARPGAGARGQGDGGDRGRAGGARRLHRRSRRWPTPIPSPTTRP